MAVSLAQEVLSAGGGGQDGVPGHLCPTSTLVFLGIQEYVSAVPALGFSTFTAPRFPSLVFDSSLSAVDETGGPGCVMKGTVHFGSPLSVGGGGAGPGGSCEAASEKVGRGVGMPGHWPWLCSTQQGPVCGAGPEGRGRSCLPTPRSVLTLTCGPTRSCRCGRSKPQPFAEVTHGQAKSSVSAGVKMAPCLSPGGTQRPLEARGGARGGLGSLCQDRVFQGLRTHSTNRRVSNAAAVS